MNMKTRRFGRSGHQSTLAIFGAAALSRVTQDIADETMEKVIAAGINHIDVAPSYGQAEARLASWMALERDRFFLGCKTMERSRAGAAAELRASLSRLQVERFDLYQLHAVTSLAELDAATAPGGALEAVIAARDEGLTDYIGITGHGIDAPAVFIEALNRFDFDSVLFPVSFVLYAQPAYRAKAEELLELCRQRDVGVMAIKAVAKGPWGDQEPTHSTWYDPFTAAEVIQDAVNFTLSQPVTGICTPGDVRLLPDVIRSCENFLALNETKQEAQIAAGAAYEPLFS
jgi:aryl-alcohol dehydrogenase-like predicted oxidoreductase